VRTRWDWGWAIPLAIAGVLLAVLAIGRLAIGFEAIGEIQQLDYGEPIVYGQAARLVAGEPLYQHLDRAPFTVAAYTPVYYALAAGLQAVVGSGFASGRALSYAAGLMASVAVAWLTARHARSVWAGAFAAIAFVALGFAGTVPWFALYRVDVLAEALSLGAIVVLVRGTTRTHVVVAGLLAGLAILTKQSYAAALLAGTLWLLGVRLQRALLFGGVAGLLTLAVGGASEVATGAFVANTIGANANPLALDQLTALVLLFGQTLGLPLVLAGAYVAYLRPWRRASARSLLVVYWVASALPLAGMAKFGASYNYWIEFAASTAVLATLGLWAAAERSEHQHLQRFASRGLAWLFTVNLIVLAPASVAAAATGLGGGATLTGMQPATRADFQQLVDLVRYEPGPVLAEPLDVLVLSGRPVLLEPVIFSILERQGTWDPDPLVRQICAGEVRLVVLGFPMDAVAQYAPYGEPWWPPRVMRALQDCMQPAGQRAGRFLYVPIGPGG